MLKYRQPWDRCFTTLPPSTGIKPLLLKTGADIQEELWSPRGLPWPAKARWRKKVFTS